jgi:hypothetical protein
MATANVKSATHYEQELASVGADSEQSIFEDIQLYMLKAGSQRHSRRS